MNRTRYPMDIRLRPWHYGDVNHLPKLANNINIWNQVRDVFPHPYTRKHAEEWVFMHQGKKPVSSFAIEVDGKLAGGIGLLAKDDIYRCSMEIGYWLGESFWGKGIATESIRILVAAIWQEYPEVVRIYAEVFPQNTASCRVLEKNGFYLETIRKNAVVKNGVLGDDKVYVALRPETVP